MSTDPFEILSLPPSASAAEVFAARRRLARALHPDVGGDDAGMRAVNGAVDEALRRIRQRDLAFEMRDQPATDQPATDEPVPDERGGTGARGTHRRGAIGAETASFTVEALPVVTHQALSEVAATIGRLIADDPPYLLEAMIETAEHGRCWCLLEVLPEAGSSSVNVFAARMLPHDGTAVAADQDLLDAVRDVWIAALNALDWGALEDDRPQRG